MDLTRAGYGGARVSATDDPLGAFGGWGRPHPSIPVNRVAAPIVGLVDQAVDTLTDRPTTVEEL